MIKSLVISNNIKFVQKLASEIYAKNLNIIFTSISTNSSETYKAINSLSPDILFLDKNMTSILDKSFITKYLNITIILSSNYSSHFISSKKLEKIYNIIKNNVIDSKKVRIEKELEYIGYKPNLKGTHYLAEAIFQMSNFQEDALDNLQGSIYPAVAKKYAQNVENIKACIFNATDIMYCECDANKLADYFKFNYDTKPTVKQVAITVLNKII